MSKLSNGNGANGHPPKQPTTSTEQNNHERQVLLPKLGVTIPPHSDYHTGPYDHLLHDDNESEAGRREACRGMTSVAVLLFGILVFLRYSTSWFFQTQDPASTGGVAHHFGDEQKCPKTIPFCHLPHDKHVVTSRKGFPSFWDYATQGAINVTYDGRSFQLNGDRALFLSGSMHPIRATKQTWDQALDEAVKQGLNMITIYVFWAEHQPLPDQEIDWTLPAGRGMACQGATGTKRPAYCGWSLADAIRAAANRGLFVHARIGPYTCAEYNYGGIPEWVALHNPNIAMRRLNKEWMDAMRAYVKSTIEYLAENNLFAYQGGNIVMAQIENELGAENGDTSDIPMMDDDIAPSEVVNDNDHDSFRRHLTTATISSGDDYNDDDYSGEWDLSDVLGEVTVQDYADWCGSLVERLAPDVVWTMCNGLSAKNTILTCNGDCSTKWLEKHGDTGRIQVDQPAMWSEDEGGFQIWGDDAKAPSNYFWGRTARAMAFDAVRWFARGGSHLNYYMWWGGYNRGRASAAGIMNGYATDAPVCASGQPRYPKFAHFQSLHRAIASVAPILLESPTEVNNAVDIERMNESGEWEISGEQRMFVYRINHDALKDDREALFVENDSKTTEIVRINLGGGTRKEVLIIEMSPFSAMILKDGAIKFDSYKVSPNAMAYQRKLESGKVKIFGWASCAEPIGAKSATVLKGSSPIEQTSLNIDADISSDYAWFETSFEVETSLDDASIVVETQKGSAMVLFVDGFFQQEAYEPHHAEGNKTYTFHVGSLESGHHKLAILSESLGYFNLVGRWGAGTGEKVKGITGDVLLVSSDNGNQSLVGEDTKWLSSPGLNGGVNGFCEDIKDAAPVVSTHPQWSTAMFNTPNYDPSTHALYLNITSGRGHVWLNNHDLGRFWNITRGDTNKYSQQYYFLPFDLLDDNGSVNTLVFFDALGSDLTSTQLVLSWLEETDFPNLQDEVDYPEACI